MTTSPQVVVVGSYVQDLVWRCPTFPRAGQTVVGPFSTGPGGKGSNQAVAASRAGAKTLFVGAVGGDAFAREAAAFYRQEGIACQLAHKTAVLTGTAAILVDQSGQNQIVVSPGANLRLRKSDVPTRAIRQAQVVVTQLESSMEATLHALKTGRKAGAVTILNPAPMPADLSRDIFRYVDVLIPNETEFSAIVCQCERLNFPNFTEAALQTTPLADLHGLCRALGIPTVIVTLGSRGCFVSEPGGFQHIPGHSGINVVDTTGAGDAFVGGFAAALVKHDGDIARATRFANAVAALSVTKPGTSPAMPRAREIARFLNRQP